MMKYVKIYNLAPQMSYTINSRFWPLSTCIPPHECPSSFDTFI